VAKKYWLMKSEPDVWSYDDHAAEGVAEWDGIRNYQARNFMRDDFEIGDTVLFYHSNHKPPHVAGICEVVREAYPDSTAFDPDAKYYDPKSDPENPRWLMVDLKAVRKLERPVSLAEIKANPALADMRLVARGNRLSIMPVEKAEYEEILRMAKSDPED